MGLSEMKLETENTCQRQCLNLSGAILAISGTLGVPHFFIRLSQYPQLVVSWIALAMRTISGMSP